MVQLTALLIQLPIRIVHGVHLLISETTRAKISSQFMKEFKNLECLNLDFSSQYINFNYLNNSQSLDTIKLSRNLQHRFIK